MKSRRKKLIDMNEEEKKAIKKIVQLVEYLKKWNENFTVIPEDVKYFEKVLEMVKTYMRMTNEGIEDCLEYEEELDKKDKMIGFMATAIDNYDSQLEICKFKNRGHVIEYFENLVEKENK